MQLDQVREPARLRRLVYWPAKLGQLLLLLLSLSAFAYGAYENVASAYFRLRAEPVVGRVSSIDSPGRNLIGGYGGTLRFPTIEYHWPSTSPDSRWIVSVVPRDDLRAGERVQVWVLPGAPDLARQQMPLWWQLSTFALLLSGFLASRYLVGSWYALDAAFGRPLRGLSGAGWGMFHGLAGRRLVVLTGPPVLLTVALYAYFVPFLMPNELAYFWNRPGGLLYVAGARGGPPAVGPLNRHERRLLSIPGYGRAASRDGFERALWLADMPVLDRYIAAIADPTISFEVDMSRAPALLMARSTEILERFLGTGIEVPAAARRQMRDIAERQHIESKLRVLDAYGITREAMAR
jgi:Protein of unknown function (DUF3592)